MKITNKYKMKPAKADKSSVRFNSVKHLEVNYPSLDAGGANDFSVNFGICNFIETDLNKEFVTDRKYKTITSFEVIEHLQNIIVYLDSIYNALDKGGKLYLTTPVRWIFKFKYHFHEFNKEELLFCLKLAGFEDIEIMRIQAYNLKHFGIRPLIRKIRDLLFGQCFLVIAKK